jgi:hypothetical protein
VNQRVRVTSPQTRLALRRRRSNPRLSPGTPGGFDHDAAAAAMLRQRRLAVSTVVLLLGLLAVLVAAGALIEGRVGWLVLFALPYPLLLGLAVRHVRRAERIESDV